MEVALLGLPYDELTTILGGPGRAMSVLRCLREGIDPREPPHLSLRTLKRLAEATTFHSPRILRIVAARDGTRKLLIEVSPETQVETILIPEGTRTTACLSSQVGCARGCSFCLTAQMGLKKNLAPQELVAQVFAAIRIVRGDGLPPLRNLVFMGMGEPLDNLRNVQRALGLLVGGRGLGFGPRFITVSTVGPSPAQIFEARRLVGRLAWSLHAADDDVRRALVPTQRHSVLDLLKAFESVYRERSGPLFVELTLLEGVNDGREHADAVALLFRDWKAGVRFNLLPWNAVPAPTQAPTPVLTSDPISASKVASNSVPTSTAVLTRGSISTPIQTVASRSFRPSPPEAVDEFRKVLMDHGHIALVRRARGDDVGAACGQLALEQEITSR